MFQVKLMLYFSFDKWKGISHSNQGSKDNAELRGSALHRSLRLDVSYFILMSAQKLLAPKFPRFEYRTQFHECVPGAGFTKPSEVKMRPMYNIRKQWSLLRHNA